ncbi:hypothetical protein B0H63DRAFT_565204 [Podospora didyma]|uniref:Protein kinase domain-containing protein n=1 Tax=Podospora didyma TaxID=330526 RepID=A0AAE0N3Y3_9PEZI|nr:hypothetical protein B0H63DRAFT_565204 [Podospora didyma]
MDLNNSSSTTPAGSHNDWFKAAPHEITKGDKPPTLVNQLRSHFENISLLSGIGNLSSFKDQTFDGFLGDGSFYDVQRKEMQHDGQTRIVAVKRLKPTPSGPSLMSGSSPGLRPMIRDVLIMTAMKGSPFILELIDNGSWPEKGFRSTPYCVVELSVDGTLSKFLDIKELAATNDFQAHVALQYQVHDYERRKSLIIDVAMGLFVLHRTGIFHTDLKPDNILIFSSPDGGYRAKLSDFGSSIMRNKAAPDHHILYGRDSGGTEGYMAPELSKLSSVDIQKLSDSELRKLDMFSFAPVMIEAISSCRATGFPLHGKYTERTGELMSFVRDHVGDSEWDTAILRILDKCLASSTTRCDAISEVLALLGKVDLDPFAESVPSAETLSSNFSLSLSAMMDNISHMLGEEIQGDFDVTSELQETPIAAFDSTLSFMRNFRTGLSDLQPFQELLRQWNDTIPRDSSQYYVVSGLSHVFGCGLISFENCCADLLEAAKRENIPAQIIYRRMHEALFSISSIEETGDSESTCPSGLSPLAIQDINPEIFDNEEMLRNEFPDNFIAQAIRFFERWGWATEVYHKLCEIADLSPVENSAWDIRADNDTIRDEQIQDLVRERTEALKALSQAPAALTDYDLMVAAAILFGDEHSSELRDLCEVLQALGVSLHFRITSLGEDISNIASPLMLACYCGNATAVRILAEVSRGSASNTLKGTNGQIPLHYLFTFRDEDADEICDILSQDVQPEDTDSDIHRPAGGFCALVGTPLDISLKVGSLAATRALWRRVYSGNQPFLLTVSPAPGLGYQNPKFKIPSSMINPGDTPVLDIFAIKCFASMQPTIWEFFLSILDDDTKRNMTSSFRELVFAFGDDPGQSRGLYYFLNAYSFMSLSSLSHMILHGPRYTERLVSHLRNGITFFLDVEHPELMSHLLGPLFTWPEPHTQVAMVEACRDLTTTPELAAYDNETLKGIMFLLNTQAANQGLSCGHLLGFILPRMQPASIFLEALAAAASADDIPAFQRIARGLVKQQMNLVDEGAIQFLCAHFASKGCPRDARLYLDMISAMDVPSSPPWLARRAPRWESAQREHEHSKTGSLLSDAVKHKNLDLILLLVDQDPSRLYPGLRSGALFLLCVNDRFEEVLRGLLEHLGPARSIEILRRRSRFSRLTAIDVAIFYNSTQCLRRIAECLTAGGFSMSDLFPLTSVSDKIWGPMMGSLNDSARGQKVTLGVLSLMASRSPMDILSRQWRLGVGQKAMYTFTIPSVLAMSQFVLEMSRSDPEKYEAVQSLTSAIYA